MVGAVPQITLIVKGKAAGTAADLHHLLPFIAISDPHAMGIKSRNCYSSRKRKACLPSRYRPPTGRDRCSLPFPSCSSSGSDRLHNQLQADLLSKRRGNRPRKKIPAVVRVPANRIGKPDGVSIQFYTLSPARKRNIQHGQGLNRFAGVIIQHDPDVRKGRQLR